MAKPSQGWRLPKEGGEERRDQSATPGVLRREELAGRVPLVPGEVALYDQDSVTALVFV